MIYDLTGISGEKATVGNKIKLERDFRKFLEGDEFSRTLGMFREQEKRSRIMNNITKLRKTVILSRIAKGHFNDIKKIFVVQGPLMPSRVRDGIKRGDFKAVEIFIFMRKIRDIALKVREIDILKAKPQGGWDPLGTKSLASSIGEVAKEATNLKQVFESKTDDVVSVGRDMNATLMAAINCLIPAFAKTNETVGKLAEDFEKASATAEKISIEGVGVNLDLSFFKAMFEDPMQSLFALGLLYLFVEYIDHNYNIPELSYVKVMIGSVAIFKCGGALKDLFLSWLKQSVSTKAQASWTDWLTVAGQGVIFAVFGATLDVSTLTKAIRSLADASSNVVRLQEVFTTILDWFKKIGSLICNFFGKETYSWLHSQNDVLNRFVEKVNELNGLFCDDPMSIDLDFVNEVTKLMMEVNDYSKTVPITSKNTPVLVAIKGIQDKLSKLQVVMAGIGLNIGERCEPAFDVLSGAPGVGKTYFTAFKHQYIIMQCAQSVEEVVEAAKNWEREVYSWPMENKHHDMYRGQKIISYPDLFCQTDAEGVVGEPASIVYLVGDQPMTLPAADIGKKQKLHVISDVITANSNILMIHRSMFKSIRNPDAVIRRANENGHFMYVNEKYAKKIGDKFVVDPTTARVRGYEHCDYLYAALDRTKVPENTVPEDCYFFRKLDYSKGAFADNIILTQRAYLEKTFAYIKEKKRAGEIKKNLLRQQVNNLAAQRMTKLKEEFGEIPQAVNNEILIDETFVLHEPPPLTDYDLKSTDLKRSDRELMSDALLEARYQKYLEKRNQEEADKMEAAAMQLMEEIENEDAHVNYDTADEEGKVEAVGQSNDEVLEETAQAKFDKFLSDTTDGFMVGEIKDPEKFNQSLEFLKEHDITMKDWHVEHYENFERNHEECRNLFPKRMLPFKEYIHSTLTKEQYVKIRAQVAVLVFNFNGAGKDFEKYAEAMSILVDGLYGDMDLYPIVSTIKTSRILEFHKLSYEEVCAELTEWRIEFKFKDPFMRAANSAAVYIEATKMKLKVATYSYWDFMVDKGTAAKTTITNVISNALNLPGLSAWLTTMYYSQSFNQAYAAFLVGLGMMAASGVAMALLALLTWALLPTRKKAKKQTDEEVKEVDFEGLRASCQGSWSEADGVTKTLDRYLDNFAALYIVIHHEGKTYTRHPCNITFLGANLGLTVKHITEGILRLREVVNDVAGTKIEIIVVPFVGNAYEKSTERAFLNDVKIEGNREMDLYDLSIMRFDSKGFRNRKKLLNLIPPVACMEYMMAKTRIEGVFIERTVEKDLTFSGRENRVNVAFDFGKTIIYDTDIEHAGKTYPLSSYKYPSLMMNGKSEKFVTQEGYCASPGFMTDPRKNFCTKLGWPQAQQAWFCYFHTSLQGHIPNGVPLFREMFETWAEELKHVSDKSAADEIKENVEVYEKVFAEELGLKATAEADSFEIVEDFERLDINHTSIASTNVKFKQPYKTSIERSPLHGIDPRTRVPVRMGVVKTPDGPVDVMEKSRIPCGMNNVCLNGPLIDGIMDQAMARVMSDSSPPVHTDPMGLEQCLYGDSAYNLSGMNWQSSGGFYLKILKDYFDTDWKAKSWMLGPDQKLKPEVFRAVERIFNHFDEKLARGERIYSIAVDNIKDELLLKSKVLEGKGRLFCVYDLTYLLLSKKYFGPMAGWIFQNRIKNGIAIGVNPYSEDWDGIATKVLTNSEKCIYLDHTQFDKNQIRRIMHCLNILGDKYYNDAGSLNARIRRLLLEEVIDSVHVTMKNGKMYVYCWGQGNTSGNFFTALLNCLVNIVYVYICAIYAWLIFLGIEPNSITVLPKNPADKALAIVDLGDDVIASVNDELMPGVNFNTIKDVGKKYLNITITDELKMGGEIPDFRTIFEGSFLGRMFKLIWFNGRKRFIAPLRLYSVIERIQWIKGMYDPEIEVEKMESTFLELSLHGKDVFYSYVSRYAKACKETYGIYPRFTDFDVALNFVLNMSTDKYSFDNFISGDGLDHNDHQLHRVLQYLKKNAEMEKHVNDFVKDLDTCVDHDAFAFSGHRVVVAEDIEEIPSLRRFPQGNKNEFVADEDSMDIETEGVVETTAPVWL